MPQNTSAGETKHRRAKLGVVVVLALVFGFVLLTSGRKSPSATASAPRVATPNSAKSREVERRAAIPARPLPEIPITEIEQYNPFEFDGQSQTANDGPTKPSSVGDANEKREKRLAEQRLRASLAGQFADIILESSRGRSAKIGPHIVRQGNQIGNGVKVDHIGNSSVILQFSRPSTVGRQP